MSGNNQIKEIKKQEYRENDGSKFNCREKNHNATKKQKKLEIF